MKKTIIILSIIIVALIGIYLLNLNKGSTPVPVADNSNTETNTTNTNTNTNSNTTNIKKPITIPDFSTNTEQSIIGKSVDGRDILAYHYGTGTTELLFVGGIHGGYEWNTSLVAYKLIDYLKANADSIPANVKVTIIPVLNPDGLNTVVGTTSGNFTIADVSSNLIKVESGRFNSNNVDLNRNFDCDWKSTGVWQNKKVSGGSAAFSEPESQAIKNYIETNKPTGAVVWYSASGGVYASSCGKSISPSTIAILSAYSKASGYPSYESFDAYSTTGDMVNWFAKVNIPAISVLLTNHTDIEWQKNLAGIQALLKYYSNNQ